MPIFLITNDDGVQSPMLPPLVEHLGALGAVRVAVPAQEQSWKSKSVTRFGRVTAERISDFGVEAFAVQGTPADCINLGVHHLFSGPPDWVISGINIGANLGLAFTLNSGTVGAALEGALLGIPSVAFSLHTPGNMYRQWSEAAKITGEEELRLIQESARGARRIMRTVIRRGFPPGTMLLNVNFPKAISPTTPVRWTHLMDNRYGPLFDPDGDGFRHRYQGDSWRSEIPGNDWEVVVNGETSVTPLTFATLTAPPENPYPFEE